MQQALAAKLPEIEAKKYIAILDNITKIHVAEVNASKALLTSAADREAQQLESMVGMAHETGSKAMDQEHQTMMADKQQEAALEQSDQGHAQTLEQQKQAADLAPKPVEAKK